MPRFAGIVASLGLVLGSCLTSASAQEGQKAAAPKSEAGKAQGKARPKAPAEPKRVVKSDRAWRTQLTPEQYYVLRRKGTEQAFTGQYWNNHEDGIYACAGCGLWLFDSKTKFESRTGWPSYWSPLGAKVVRTRPDASNGTLRTEVNCRACGGHLGHVFNDGPAPTGLRYCMNSVSLAFLPREEAEAKIRELREAAEKAATKEQPKEEGEAKKEAEPVAKEEAGSDRP